MPEWLLSFDSTHHAIAAENLVKENRPEGLVMHVIPTPRQITASCGISLLFQGKDNEPFPEFILQMMQERQIRWQALFSRTDVGTCAWQQEKKPPTDEQEAIE